VSFPLACLIAISEGETVLTHALRSRFAGADIALREMRSEELRAQPNVTVSTMSRLR
jgi:hypothetical protein